MKGIKYLILLLLIVILGVSACAPAAPPAEEPAAEEPAADEPVAEEPAADEPDVEEPPAEEPAAQNFKACWVYDHAIGDQGWAYAQEQGRSYVDENMSNVETTYVEDVMGGADAERVVRQLAESGCDMIVTVSFSFTDIVDAVAPDYPDVFFESYEGLNIVADNVRIHRILFADAGYVAGVLMGSMTESNIIGFVGAFPIADLVRSINSYQLGAASVNPEAVVRVVWSNTWYDPTKEAEAALGLIAVGADVITHIQASAATIQTAEANGVWSVGYTDQNQYIPEFGLTSQIVNWGAIYSQMIETAMDGSWESEELLFRASDGAVDITSFGPAVPEDVRAIVDQVREDVNSGALDYWAGPISDNQGNVMIAEGETATLEQLLTMDWLVEGVQGTID